MKSSFISILFILTASFGILPNVKAETRIAGSNLESDRLAISVHHQVNRYRQSHNLPPLMADSQLTTLAKTHSEEMARTGNLSHGNFDRRIATITPQIANVSVAENIATNRGYQHPDRVALADWIASPSHHRNLIGRYNLTGLGVAQNGKGEYYFTQIFIRK